ncbi:MAG: Cache 3/Cache 2 fusion domain-containing protein [Syntrophobacteraceae bacterium]|nr:Cache 3/Cache 2 fusion domain-containing protein [Syntrophobacteraceae bacterium]
MRVRAKLGTRIIIQTMILSLVPIFIVTGLNVMNAKNEMEKLVRQDFTNMIGFVWEIMEAHEALVKEAEIGEEIVLILQAREQEKNFIIKEDEASIKKWHAIMGEIKKSPVYVGGVPASLKHYEAVFDKFSRGMLADMGDLARAGEALEAEIKKTVKSIKYSEYQEAIRTKVIGPKNPDGTRDLSKGIRIGVTGYIFFLKPDGKLIGHPTLESGNLPDAELTATIGQKKDGYTTYRENGRDRIAFFKYYAPWDWIVVIDAVQSEVMNVSNIIKVGAIVAGVFTLLVAVLNFFFVRSMTRPIHRLLGGLAEGANQVAAASSQVSTASQSLAEGASAQAASLEETSSSLEEMSSVTRQNAESARQANDLTRDTNEVVKQADSAMTELTVSMEEVSRASEETSKIIKTIDEIAFQTNLLALNAAVEAARAGEAGAGFAVVAEEVRNLAMRSAEAARNTSQMIESTVTKIKEGVKLLGKTNEAFGAVSRHTERVGQLVERIAAASNEQALGIEQVNRAASEMDRVTQQTAASAEESASASAQLSAQAEQMLVSLDDLLNLIGGRNGKEIKETREYQAGISEDQTKRGVERLFASVPKHGTAPKKLQEEGSRQAALPSIDPPRDHETTKADRPPR